MSTAKKADSSPARPGSLLRQNIAKITQPFQKDVTKPPFDIEQLVLFAFVMEQRPLSHSDVFRWIIQNFAHYHKLAVEGLVEHVCWSGANRNYEMIQMLRESIFGVFDCVEIPFAMCSEGKRAITSAEISPILSQFAQQSDTARQKSFDFFGLPTELRNIIYNIVFRYDGTLVVSVAGRRAALKGLCVVSKGTNLDVGFPWNKRTRQLGTILAPLRTSRQFFQEAMPTFYRENTFGFTGLGSMLKFLDNLPSRRSKHVAKISTVFKHRTHGTYDDAPRAFRALAALPNLRSLDLRMNENRHLVSLRLLAQTPKLRELSKEDRDTLLSKIKGVAELGNIRGLQEVNFTGPCPGIERMVKHRIMQPRNRPVTRWMK